MNDFEARAQYVVYMNASDHECGKKRKVWPTNSKLYSLCETQNFKKMLIYTCLAVLMPFVGYEPRKGRASYHLISYYSATCGHL